MIRVLLADDQALIRAGFRALLDAEDDLEVIAEAADGREAVARAREYRPDVALLDISMPVQDGIEATREIVADGELTGVRIVILTNFGLDEYIYQALSAGASGFLLKDIDPADLLRGVRMAVRGDALLSPSVTRRLIGEYVALKRLTPEPAGGYGRALELLTAREREIVALVARGLSNTEIAEHLVISPTTAKTHVSRAMVKLDARDRAQLVVFAYQSGLAAPGPRPSDTPTGPPK